MRLALLSLALAVLSAQPALADVVPYDEEALELEQCDEFNTPPGKDELDALEATGVTDRYVFECEIDWIRTERLLQPLLPLIGEQSYANYERPEESNKTVAIRLVTVAYNAVSLVRSIECHIGNDPQYSYRSAAIGGIARTALLWPADNDEERGLYQIELSASDCDYLLNTIKNHDPFDIEHRRPFGNPISPDGQIILVHGYSFMEFIDDWGEYGIIIRPGIHGPGARESEVSERVLKALAGYFAHRAQYEGVKTDLPPFEGEEDPEK